MISTTLTLGLRTSAQCPSFDQTRRPPPERSVPTRGPIITSVIKFFLSVKRPSCTSAAVFSTLYAADSEHGLPKCGRRRLAAAETSVGLLRAVAMDNRPVFLQTLPGTHGIPRYYFCVFRIIAGRWHHRCLTPYAFFRSKHHKSLVGNLRITSKNRLWDPAEPSAFGLHAIFSDQQDVT